jgi:hypothetical protein
MTSIQDLLDEAIPPPRRAIDVTALKRTARRRRARRRITATSVAVVALAGIAGAIVAALPGRSGGHVQVASNTASDAAAGVSVELPAGWKNLPLLNSGSGPVEVLVVGTADPPAQMEPILACQTSQALPQSAYVSVYEYSPGQPFALPGNEGELGAATFRPQPADFTGTAVTGSDCSPTPGATPAPPTATSPSHFLYFAFTSSGHYFFAKVLSNGDPTKQLLQTAVGVLNTFRAQPDVATPAPSTPSLSQTATTTTLPKATGPGPKNPIAARHDIQNAFIAAFDNTGPVAQADSVEGGFPLSSASQQAGRNANPTEIGAIVVRINWLVFLDATQADLNFDLLVNNQPITANTTGTAIVQGGIWRVGRSTYCDIVNRGGTITCPS